MSRSAQSLLPPRAVLHTVVPADDLRTPAERVRLIAVWAGMIAFSLAFWAAAVAMICMA